MKKVIPILIAACCFPLAYAGYTDGLIGPGEYEYGMVEWGSGLLTVDGGGAALIMILSPAQLEVRSTSTPLGDGVGGIMDIVLYGQARMDYYGGLTQELTTRGNSISNLYGGRIDYITSRQNVDWVYGQPQGQHINIYAKKDTWSWTYENGVIRGITGQWLNDGSTFNIRFLNDSDYDPVWANVKVIPEPATLSLLALGGLLLRRRKP